MLKSEKKTKINIKNDFRRWVTIQEADREVYVTGSGWHGDVYHDVFELASLVLSAVARCSAIDDFVDFAKKINGSFAIVLKWGSRYVLVADRLRSIPIFYELDQGTVYITNFIDIERYSPLDDKTFKDNIELLEFICAGYVTGRETLAEGVYQVQAGEIVCIDENSTADYIQYYEFRHEMNPCCNEEELSSSLYSVIDTVFDRVAKIVGGRTVVIPLSGGWDSRLIVGMLKRKGITDVICFTYGNKDSSEVKISKQIAERLDYDWYFVEYTPALWSGWIESEWMDEYWWYSSNAASLPHFQDGPAIFELKRDNILPGNCIFLPGHTGDFLSGGHIPREVNESVCPLPINIMNYQFRKHYALWNEKSYYSKIQGKTKTQLLNFTADKNIFADEFEFWDWKERQAKYIVNSCRMYEFLGFDWYMPLWDHELMDFYSNVPLELRIAQKLYLRTLTNSVFTAEALPLRTIPIANSELSPVGTLAIIDNPPKKPAKEKFFTTIKILILNFGILSIARSIKQYFYHPHAHAMGFHCWFSANKDPLTVRFKMLLDDDKNRMNMFEKAFFKKYGNSKLVNLDCLGILSFVFVNKLFKKKS